MVDTADMADLRGRHAVITGAASGLGREFAVAFAGCGATVLCADVDESVHDTAGAIVRAGGKAFSSVADVADEQSVAALAETVRTSFGVLHILMNNAGMASAPNRLQDVSIAEWDRVININLRSVFLCSKAMLPMLLLSKNASVINISSLFASRGSYPGFPVTAIAYGASKAGIEGFTRQLAIEYARDGIRVNAIAPGWHGGTRLGRERRSSLTSEELERYEAYVTASVPMGRRGTPVELTGLALYLASDASRYVSGQVFAHDGGASA